MTIGIYTPYRNTLGGGEQYLFTIASCLLANNHRVIFYSETDLIVKAAEKRFGLSLDKLIIQPPIFEQGTFLQKIHATKSLDVLFYCSDGSLPVSFASRTYVLFQFPVPWVRGISFTNQLKMKKITSLFCYSQFVKEYLDTTFKTKSIIVPPAIRVEDYIVGSKEKLILTVGRFTNAMNMKRQDVMIQTFKTLIDQGLRDWRFVLAGGTMTEETEYVAQLTKQAQGYPIEIQSNIERKNLLELYSHAAIYWHAAGYGVDISKNPQLVEHFGITTLEAMASEAIPIVFPAGGQKEIVTDTINGFYWKTIEELIEKTTYIIEGKQTNEVRENCKKSAAAYDRKQFCSKINQLVI